MGRKQWSNSNRTHPPFKFRWMADLAVSLSFVFLALSWVGEGAVTPLLTSPSGSRGLFKRETNPPFQFTVYSDETDGVTTTWSPNDQGEEEEEMSTLPSPNSSFEGRNDSAYEDISYSYSASSSTETESPLPTFEPSSSSNMEEELEPEGSEGTTYTSLLSPLPTTSSASTPFSAILMNKTARNFSNRVGIRGLELQTSRNRESANSVLAPSDGETTNGPLLRAARPTSQVIFNSPGSSYNRVVKRKKITSISGRNVSRTPLDSTTPTATEREESTTLVPEEESTPSHNVRSSNLTQPSLNSSSSNSRAIAGFSSKGPVKIVTKTRPKPIIIRDHEAYFRNVSTEASSPSSSSTLREETGEATTEESPTALPPGSNTLPSPPFKVRRVKVTMRRPGGVVSSDAPDAVQFVVSPPSSSSGASSSLTVSQEVSATPSMGLSADAGAHASPAAVDYESIRPSPSMPFGGHPYDKDERGEGYETPLFSSRRVFKEEFGVERDTYGSSEEEEGEGRPDEFDSDATTEHYHSVEPPSRIESSMDDHPHLSMESGPAPTPKYRDYFSEIGSVGVAGDAPPRDNQNHLYSHNNNIHAPHGEKGEESPAVTSVTVTVTKTIIHDTPTTTPPSPSSHAPLPLPPYENVNNHFEPTPTLPDLPSSTPRVEMKEPHPQGDSDKSTSHVHGEVGGSGSPNSVTSNSVEDIELKNFSYGNSSQGIITNSYGHGDPSGGSSGSGSSSGQDLSSENGDERGEVEGPPYPPPGGTKVLSSKGVTSVYYTKVEQPYFTSSSYEFSTSSTFSYHVPHDDHSHHSGEEQHSPEGDNPSHEIEYTPKGQELSPFTTTKPFWEGGATATLGGNSTQSPPVVIDQEHGLSTPQIDTELVPPTGVTKDQDLNGTVGGVTPTRGREEVTLPPVVETKPPLTGVKEEEKGGAAVKEGAPHGNFPAMYQVPVLVKMVLEMPHPLFCSHVANFKEMIVEVYAERQTGGRVSADQIVVLTQPNCTAVQSPSPDQGPHYSTDPYPSVPVNGTGNTLKPPPPHTTLKAEKGQEKRNESELSVDTTTTPTTKHSEVKGATTLVSNPSNATGKRVQRRKRDSLEGQSLILDRKGDLLLEGADKKGKGDNSTQGGEEEEEPTLFVYFFVNDKEGKYDRHLTMTFLSLWNESLVGGASGRPRNGTFFQGIFYRIKGVDMIGSSGLVAPSDDPLNENSGIIAAIAIASIAATCLFLIGVLLLVLRHRQAQTKFAKRCTPVTLDDYSLDNISFSNSFRRKQRLRGSKRSYTNAAFDDHSAPSRVVNSGSLHKALNDASALESEFHGIPSVSPTLDDIPQGAEGKNRYANVIPMPDTRVILTFQDEQPNSDYINANYVRGVNGEGKRYIITQGPLEETCVDFWRLVWEQQVRVILMITDFAEAGIGKCAEYYPRSETIDCSQLHGDYQVTLEKRDITDSCITSYLVIKDMERNLRRDVIHLWFHSWPDRGVPPGPKPTADFLLKARKFTKELTPILVHCSPGTGRSGTLVACDILMKEFEMNGKVDIPRTVLRLRQDRAGCVQTKEQYTHIYQVIQFYASRLSPTQIESIPP